MNILKELLYGNICPYDDRLGQSKEEKEILHRIIETEKELLEGLTPEKRELYEKCKECIYDLSDVDKLSIFTEGFRIGARLTFAAFADPD